jgi:hypothetical protein
VDAGGAVGSCAVAEGDAAALEAAEELVPFGVGGGAVFLAGAELAPAVNEGAVAVDGFLGVDRFVAHCGVGVFVSEYELGDVGRHAVEDGVVVKIPLKSWGW